MNNSGLLNMENSFGTPFNLEKTPTQQDQILEDLMQQQFNQCLQIMERKEPISFHKIENPVQEIQDPEKKHPFLRNPFLENSKLPPVEPAPKKFNIVFNNFSKGEDLVDPFSEILQIKGESSKNTSLSQNDFVPDDSFMKKVLEDYGFKVNNSMSKNLVKRLYSELEVYFDSGQIPEHLTAEEFPVAPSEDAMSEVVPFILPTLDSKIKQKTGMLYS